MDATSPCCWSSTYTEIQIFDVMVFVRYDECIQFVWRSVLIAAEFTVRATNSSTFKLPWTIWMCTFLGFACPIKKLILVAKSIQKYTYPKMGGKGGKASFPDGNSQNSAS